MYFVTARLRSSISRFVSSFLVNKYLRCLELFKLSSWQPTESNMADQKPKLDNLPAEIRRNIWRELFSGESLKVWPFQWAGSTTEFLAKHINYSHHITSPCAYVGTNGNQSPSLQYVEVPYYNNQGNLRVFHKRDGLGALTNLSSFAQFKEEVEEEFFKAVMFDLDGVFTNMAPRYIIYSNSFDASKIRHLDVSSELIDDHHRGLRVSYQSNNVTSTHSENDTKVSLKDFPKLQTLLLLEDFFLLDNELNTSPYTKSVNKLLHAKKSSSVSVRAKVYNERRIRFWEGSVAAYASVTKESVELELVVDKENGSKLKAAVATAYKIDARGALEEVDALKNALMSVV